MANNQVPIEFIARFRDEISRDAKKAKASLTDMGKGTKKVGTNLKDLVGTLQKVGAGVAVVGATFKKAFDLAKLGNQITQTTQSFEMMTDRVGQVPGLLDDLRASAKGTITDFDLMRGTMSLLAGTSGELERKLAGATPQLLDIAKAANKLNPALGDTSFMFQSIALGIKRSQPLILDNLGIVVKLNEAYKAYADTLGKNVMQLTAEEKQFALLNATMDAGQNLINQVGGNTDAAGDSMQRFETRLMNMKDGFLEFLAEGLNPYFDALDGATRIQDALNEALARGVLEINKNGAGYKNAQGEIVSWREGVWIAIDAQENLNERQRDQNRYLAEANFMWQAHRTQLNKTPRSYRDVQHSIDNVRNSMGELTKLMLFNQVAEGLSDEQTRELALGMGILEERTLGAYDAADRLKQSWIESGREVGALTADVMKLWNTLDLLPKHIDVKVLVTIEEEGHSAFVDAGGQVHTAKGGYQNPDDNKPKQQAKGGNLGMGTTEVHAGEWIVPSANSPSGLAVLPASVVRSVKRFGLMPTNSRAIGGPIDVDVGEEPDFDPLDIEDRGSLDGGTGGGGGGGGGRRGRPRGGGAPSDAGVRVAKEASKVAAGAATQAATTTIKESTRAMQDNTDELKKQTAILETLATDEGIGNAVADALD